MSLDICERLKLDELQCKVLAEYLSGYCSSRGERKKSRWQECISSRRKGQPFDPNAMRELAKEYKAGRCP